MYSSATAEWLDRVFSGYDHFFLNILHVLGDKAGGVLTPLMRFITFLGEKGIVFFLLALIFMLMADKRELGVCIFGAVCCGALITNIILKDSVGRVRPYEAVAEYNAWWQALGAPVEDDFSFPSGHVTACAAAMTAITLMRGKKWIVPSVIIVFLMGVARNYLMAHYPSDVLFAVIIGVFSGIVAWLITQVIFRYLRRNRRRNPLCADILDFDIRDVLPFPLPGFAAAAPRAKSARAARPARSTRSARPAPVKESAPAGEDEDGDVKTYSGSHEAQAEEAPAPRRARASAPASIFPRKTRAASASSEEAPAAEDAEAEAAPRRARPAGAHSTAYGGRHAIEPAAPSAPRAASKLRVPGAYQGKHVK